jgi:hypothetical protein
MKMFKFTYKPDGTNPFPWQTDAAFALLSFGEPHVYSADASDPESPIIVKTIWVSEKIKSRYQKHLERYELTEVEITHNRLVELGANRHF